MKFDFGHLFGNKPGKRAKPAKAEAPEEEEDDPQTETDDDNTDAEEEEEEPQTETDDDDTDAEEEEEEEPAAVAAKGKPKSVKQRIAAARKAGAKAEKDRIAGILGHEAAAGRGEVALSLAMNTDMTVDQAVASLSALPKGRGRLAEEMPSRDPKIGTHARSDSKGSVARLAAAVEKKAAAHKEKRGR